MKQSLIFCSLLFTVLVSAQPTIDGTISDASYTTTLLYTSGRDGFGSTNNLGYVKIYTDGSDIYIGIESKFESNGNRIVLFLNFSDYNGRAAGNALGTFSGATGVIPASGNTNIRLGMEADYVFEFNTGDATNCYFDANRLGTSGFFNTGTFVGSCNLTGTASTPSSLNTNVFSSGSPNVTFAYNNGGGSNQGLELKIPINSLPGVNNTHTMQVLAILANNGTSGGTFFSNECIPGDPGASNAGVNPDLNALTGSSLISLPVELTMLRASFIRNLVKLEWRTAMELDNSGFEIERKQDARWQTIGFVEGNGTTNAPQEYQFNDKGLSPGKYLYRLKQINRDGTFDHSGEVEATVILSEESYALSQNFPNPFNPSTTFTYAVKERQHVSVSVFDGIGREVATLVDDVVEPNILHSVTFDGSALASGIYFYSLRTPGRHEIRKLMLMK